MKLKNSPCFTKSLNKCATNTTFLVNATMSRVFSFVHVEKDIRGPHMCGREILTRVFSRWYALVVLFIKRFFPPSYVVDVKSKTRIVSSCI